MPRNDPRVTAYIAKQAPFARPILKYLRAVVHEGCPEVTETLKWGMPSFEYHGILCGMAAFKAHATFGFWKGKEIIGDAGSTVDAMGQFGRITSVKELPARARLIGWVKQAALLNEAKLHAPKTSKSAARPKVARPARPALRAPADLSKAIEKSARARAVWDGFPPSSKRDYAEWIREAKQEATRVRRIATAVAWIAEGKRRNWKYER